jgi:hypothetical protein
MANKITVDQAYSLEHKYSWSHVESEGGFAIRYDFGREYSLWMYTSGTAEGHAPKAMKKLIEETGIDTKYLKYV